MGPNFQETESWWKVQCTILIKYSELKVKENKTLTETQNFQTFQHCQLCVITEDLNVFILHC